MSAEEPTSGDPWLDDLPGRWRTQPLKALFQVVGGSTPKSDIEKYWDGGIGWFTPADLASDGIARLRQSQRTITEEGLDSCGTTLVPEQSIVLSTRAPIGSLGIAEVPLCTNQGCKSLVPRIGANSPYYSYVLSISTERLRVRGKGTTFLELSSDELGAFRVPVPPTPEQAAIAAFLDCETGKIDALVEEQRRLIDLLKEKRQAVISQAVTKGLDPHAKMKPSGVEWLGEVPEHWTVTKLGRYISILSGFVFPSTGFSMEDEDVRLLRGINVGVGNIRWDEVVYWRRQDGDGLDRFELKEGQIIVGMDRPWIADGVRVARVTADDVPSLLLQRVTAISCKASVSDDFAYLLLTSQNFVAYFTPDMTGVSVPHLSPEQIELFTVAVPSPTEQIEIVAFVRKETRRIEALLSEAEGAVRLLLERRSALISAAVTGKIDVRLAEQPGSDDVAAIADEVAA